MKFMVMSAIVAMVLGGAYNMIFDRSVNPVDGAILAILLSGIKQILDKLDKVK